MPLISIFIGLKTLASEKAVEKIEAGPAHNVWTQKRWDVIWITCAVHGTNWMGKPAHTDIPA